MSSGLAEFLFKDYRSKVLGLLLLRPDEEFHVREIARLTGTIPGTLHRELSALAQASVLRKTKKINQVTYRANTDCVIYQELASILRKTSGLAEVIAARLPLADNSLLVAAIYGSIASGRETAASDVDLLIIGDVGLTEIMRELHLAQDALGREINPVVYGRAEWREALAAQSLLTKEILSAPLIFLKGCEDDLGEPSRDNARKSAG